MSKIKTPPPIVNPPSTASTDEAAGRPAVPSAMTFEEQCAAARREIRESVERARRECPPVRAVIAEFTAARQARVRERIESRAELWGSPSGSSFAKGTAGLPGPRNRAS